MGRWHLGCGRRQKKELDLVAVARSSIEDCRWVKLFTHCFELFWPVLSPNTVKTVRICLLLLLALLLPVRGAIAVAMDCSVPGSRAQAEAQVTTHSQGPQVAVAGQVHRQHTTAHDHTSAEQNLKGAGHEHAEASDKCNLCSASCSATALMRRSIVFAEPLPVSAVFLHLHALPPSFVPEGQERPPRTI